MTGRGLAIGSRIAAGVVGMACAGGLVAAAALLPLPELSAGVPSVLVTPVAADQQRVCPGPLLRLGEADGGGATTLSPVGKAKNTYSTASGEDIIRSGIKAVDVEGSRDGLRPVQLTAPSAEGDTGLLAGSQSQTALESDVAGFSAAACTEAVGTSWLIGGATDVGRTTLVLLSNPAEVDALVDLAVWGETGPITGPGFNDILVEAGTQRALDLAGLAPDLAAPVVRVQSSGALVSASLQHSVVRGLDPGGVEIVGRTVASSQSLVIPGVRISTAKLVKERAGVSGFADVATVLRVLPIGDADAQLTIGVVSQSEENDGTTVEAEAHAGEVTEIPIAGLANGFYTLYVESSTPIVAAARAATVAEPLPADETAVDAPVVLDGGGDTGEVPSDGSLGVEYSGDAPGFVQTGERIDMAWFPAAPQLDGDTTVAVARGPQPRLSIANPGRSDVTVEIESLRGGEPRKVTVPAGGGVSTSVRESTSYLLTGATGLQASVSFADEGQLSSYVVRPRSALASPITVYR